MHEVDRTEYWGIHLVLNVSGCQLDKIRDSEVIKSFSKALVEKIKMVPYGEPFVVHFGPVDVPNKSGWTLVQLIETSNIMAHFNDADGSAYIDVFSCKDFTKEDVFAVINDFFSPEKIDFVELLRQA